MHRFARKDRVMRGRRPERSDGCTACARQDRVEGAPEPPFIVVPSAILGLSIHSVHLMLFEGFHLSLCCNLYFSAYNYLKRAKAVEISAIKLEKELEEIKALLLQSLKHDEQSEPKNKIRGIMKSISDKYKTRESI